MAWARILLSTVLIAGLANAAKASEGSGLTEADLHGAWSFETDPYRQNCIISGQLNLDEGAGGGGFSCEFVATEQCGGPDGRSITTSQRCEARFNGESLSIWSTVDGFLNAPDGYREQQYLPDHFLVEPASAALMSGQWYDLQTSAPVTFRRPDIPVS